MKEKNKGVKMWKSGKHWLYSTGALSLLALGVTSNVKANTDPTVTQEQAGLKAAGYSDEEIEDASIIPDPEKGVIHHRELRNGAVSDKHTTVSRTNNGFTSLNSSEGVNKVVIEWVQDTKEIGITAANAFYVNTPYDITVDLTAPLAKGKSVALPIHVTGKIFNATSSVEVANFRSAPYVGQNNGNYYVSEDGSFSYDYSEATGNLTITALTNENKTHFEGMSYLLLSKNTNWSPVPLNQSIYPLAGGVVGNFGAKGSGATLTITIGDQSTSETVTNTAETGFKETLVKTVGTVTGTASTKAKANINQTQTARNSNNFLANITGVSSTTQSGTEVLDGSVDHFEYHPQTNAQITPAAATDPKKGTRFEAWVPIGSINGNNQTVIFSGSNTSDAEGAVFSDVIKNAKYDEATKIYSYDLSRAPKDWAKLAKDLLALPTSTTLGTRAQIPAVKTYLEAMAKDNDTIGNTLYLGLYSVAPNSAFIPINSDLPMAVNTKVTNSVTKQSTSGVLKVLPVKQGSASSTQTQVVSLAVDAKTGQTLGDGPVYQTYQKGEAYNAKPQVIKGYQQVSINDPALLTKLGLSSSPETGTVTDDMLGKTEYVLYGYEKAKGTLIVHYVDKEGQSIQPDKTYTGEEGTTPQVEPTIPKNYVVTTNPMIPQFESDQTKEVSYVLDNHAPITYSVIDDTTKTTLQKPTSFVTGILGTSSNSSDNVKKLTTIEKIFTEKGYNLGTVSNQDLPVPTDIKGYNIEIHLTHGTTTQVVDGPKAVTPVADRTVTQTIKYTGADKKPADDVQIFKFTAKVTQTIDKVTQQVIKESFPIWSAIQNSQAVTTPNLSGFKADQGLVPVAAYDNSSKDTVITVTYVNVKAPITYTVIDDTTKTILENKVALGTGIVGEAFNTKDNLAKLSTIEKVYTDKNYSLGAVTNVDLPIPKDTAGYDITIHLIHDTTKQTVDGTHAQNVLVDPEITRTIHYEGAGNKTPEELVQKLNFDSQVTQTIDDVTGKILSETSPIWFAIGSTKDEAAFDKVTPPTIEGYTTSETSIPTLTINHTTQSSVVNVTYSPNPAKVNVVYRDVDINATTPNAVLAKSELKGHVDEAFDNTKDYQTQLKALEAKGYQLVKVDQQSGIYTPAGQTLYVDLKHKVTTTPDYQVKDVTQTIHYVSESGKTISPDNVQVFHFTNGAAIDQVTKSDLKDNWSTPQNSKETVSPAFEGYTPNQDKISSESYSKASKDEEVMITYKADKQKLAVHFVDVEGLDENNFKKGKVLTDEDQIVDGKSDEVYSFKNNINKTLQTLSKQGYEFVSMDPKAYQGAFDHDNAKDQSYNIYLKHAKETILGGYPKADGSIDEQYNHAVKSTVHYQGAGKATPKDNVQTFNFKATVTYDVVTKIPLFVKWDKAQSTQEVASSTLKGYKVDKEKVPAIALDHSSKNLTTTVNYQKIPAVVLKNVEKLTLPSVASIPSKPQTSSTITPKVVLATVKRGELPKTGMADDSALKILGFWALIVSNFSAVLLVRYIKKQKEEQDYEKN